MQAVKIPKNQEAITESEVREFIAIKRTYDLLSHELKAAEEPTRAQQFAISEKLLTG